MITQIKILNEILILPLNFTLKNQLNYSIQIQTFIYLSENSFFTFLIVFML